LFVITFVGTIELSIYPILISLAASQPIFGWLAVKTAAGWRWKGEKTRITRFILGNAMVIFVSFFLTPMIKIAASAA
jgi:hypothetical protein